MPLLLLCKAADLKVKKVGCPDAQGVPAEMACVPAGLYTIGSDLTDFASELAELSAFKTHQVELSAFLIDKYEVTTKLYSACVASGKCTAARSNYPHMRGDNQPQLKANWFQADTFCKAAGKRLPTEAEFEAASRGPDGNMFPWGNEPVTCERAVIEDSTGRGCFGHEGKGKIATPKKFEHTGSTWEVGSKPVGRYGLYDMAGNAQEWVSDWFEKSLERCGKSCSDANPQGPCGGKATCPGHKMKVVKGGSWYWGKISARAATRRAYEPKNDPPHHFGFRCVQDIPAKS